MEPHNLHIVFASLMGAGFLSPPLLLGGGDGICSLLFFYTLKFYIIAKLGKFVMMVAIDSKALHQKDEEAEKERVSLSEPTIALK